MLLGTLGVSLLGNSLTGKGLYRTRKRMCRTGQVFKKMYLISSINKFRNNELFQNQRFKFKDF